MFNTAQVGVCRHGGKGPKEIKNEERREEDKNMAIKRSRDHRIGESQNR